jgi:hypothetical protein
MSHKALGVRLSLQQILRRAQQSELSGLILGCWSGLEL